MGDAVTTKKDGDLLVVTVNNPPVNALSHAVRQGLVDAVDELEADADLHAAILTCDGRTFMAGADIREFGKPPQAPHLGEVVERIEASDKPVVAAIFGTALGGGLEVALGCHARVAVPSAKIGLPEVKLGLLPGAGGTQRLPRLAGVENALDAMLSGRHVAADEAAGWGVIDAVVDDGALADAAAAHARTLVGKPVRRTGALQNPDAAAATPVLQAARDRIAKTARGQFAPQQIIACVEAALTMSLKDGLERERALFRECMANPQSAAMRHVFFAERQAAQVPGIDKTTPRRDIAHVGVIGAGTMGGGIAMACADAGLTVTLVEQSEDALASGISRIEGNYQRSQARGKLHEEERLARLGRISGSTHMADLGACDLIIEAVFERMDIKLEVFAKLDAVAKEGAILATNTSYLDIDEIAGATKRPGDVVGLHFFSPANVMRLLEIVRGKDTAPDVLATATALARKIGKVGVVSGNCHGFIGNRMLRGYGREANLMVIEGAAPQAIDMALRDFGMAMGPLAVSDLAGLDIGYMTRQSMGRDAYDTRAYDWLDRLVEAGRKGQKTGKGIYLYGDDRKAQPDPDVDALIEEEAAKAGVTRRTIAPDEIVERCMLALVNEGARILEEGIALRASDIDLVYLNGYGYPVFRGGPMFYADSLGLSHVAERITAFAHEDGNNWSLAPLIKRLADADLSFQNYDKGARP